MRNPRATTEITKQIFRASKPTKDVKQNQKNSINTKQGREKRNDEQKGQQENKQKDVRFKHNSINNYIKRQKKG